MPGKIMAVCAHPGDGLFTMGAALAQQIHHGETRRTPRKHGG